MTLSFSEHKMLQEVLEVVREIKEAVGCHGEKAKMVIPKDK